MAFILLHGTLHVTIIEAANIVNDNPVVAASPKFLRKACTNFARKFVGGNKNVSRLPSQLVANAEDLGSASNALYATIDLERARVGRTRMIKNELSNPKWNESFHIYSAHNVANIVISVKGDKPVGAVLFGRARVPVSRILPGNVVEGWFDLYNDAKKKVDNSKVHVKLQFFDAANDRNWGRGLQDPHRFAGVPFTYFPQRKGCKVTLYQDAHMQKNYLPQITLTGNKSYKGSSCWEDIFEAINNAKHLIYITGWSVYTEIKLVRDSERPSFETSETLGQLLKKKAKGGVRVLMLVWDDTSSVSSNMPAGLMGTHDEETAAYFRNTAVKCVLCPRIPDEGRSMIQGMQSGTLFTHHQKTVVLDAPVPGGQGSSKRRLVSFVGGIDLCDGRYDTQQHSLFRTLTTLHKEDFHQPNFSGADLRKGGPREPWHDIHSKLEGAVCWDVLTNFTQRWLKQSNDKNLLLPLEQVTDIVSPSPVTDERDQETWNVQIFRSIDGGAVSGFPENPEQAAAAGLVSGKNCTIDKSIHDAYIHAIRRAKNFIYIENQYFLGSSFGWSSDQDAEALHLIPMELTLKIVSKIEAGERFMVYVVLPMWPEGIPESGSVLAILYWTRKTMEMMYRAIAQALGSRRMRDQTPKDYLAFYCLGNKEVRQGAEYLPSALPEPNSNYLAAQTNRRFMIYVHSKMMIVDDEYIIVGSANINQRSMDGGRDTEIAMGAYQPYRTGASNSANGQIHGFRMALWYEHLGYVDNAFKQPWSLDCARKVSRSAENLWALYTERSPVDLPGHLLPYPLRISNDGSVTEVPQHATFPDTKAKVVGAKSANLPFILTT